jgi:penicillin-binding protein 1A
VLKRPVAGKTGTTNDYKDAWFVGFTPELAVGIYIGYDTPRSMGRASTGGDLVVPIFANFVSKALEGQPPTPFNMPSGMTGAWIDPASGVKADGGQAAIYEAFKPGTGPNLVTSVIGVDANTFVNIGEGQRGQVMSAPGEGDGFDERFGQEPQEDDRGIFGRFGSDDGERRGLF